MADNEQTRFLDFFRSILIKGAKQQAPDIFGSVEPPTDTESSYLLSMAARLSFSDNSDDRRRSYEIATRVLELSIKPTRAMVAAVELILSRLGNFPAKRFTEIRFGPGDEISTVTPLRFSLEEVAREVENTVEVNEREITLTDFQRRLFDALERYNSVSVSAPTSAGKSFLLSLDVVRQHSRKQGGAIVFVVPTRALIRQVMRDVIHQIRAFSMPEIPVLCVPELPPNYSNNAGIVYVLTQERLANLLSAHGANVSISLLVVDEAQELGDASRGIVLQSTIEHAMKRHPNARVLFASPLRANPGFLLTLFGRTEQGEYFVEKLSPVSQNIILISSVPRKTTMARFHLFRDDEILELGECELSFRFRIGQGLTSPQLLAYFSVLLTKNGDSTLVYVNEPTQAENTSEELCEILPPLKEIHPRIQNLIEFLQANIHRSYRLIRCLQHGVGFHYGTMPEIVRVEVEDLIRDGLIRFVCCTSTLLQGVNLPAKNVVIYRPTRGRGTPLDKGGFWNLAGRAGRLMQEYSGNVWCISPSEWEENPIDGDRLVEMHSAFQFQLDHDAKAVFDAASDADRPAENSSTILADQAFAKVYSDFALEGKKIASSPLSTDSNRQTLEQLDQICAFRKQNASIPDEFFRLHGTVLPQRIEELATLFRKTNAEHLLPLHPFQFNAYDRLKEIFHTLEQVFFKTGTDSYVYHTLLAYRWMTGTHLAALVAGAIEHNKVGADDRRGVSKAVRGLLGDIQNQIRFKYVKYVRVYIELLEIILHATQQNELRRSMSPLHLYLEYGACVDAIIHLMSLGLSRTSALGLAAAAGLPNGADWEECRQLVETADLESLRLPAIVTQEIRSIRHSSVKP